jgi:predicted dehydrogenase
MLWAGRENSEGALKNFVFALNITKFTKIHIMKRYFLLLIPVIIGAAGLRSIEAGAQAPGHEPVRVAIAGVSHGHSSWIYGRKNTNDIHIAGIYEPDAELVKVFSSRYNLDGGLFHNDLAAMLDKVKPTAVLAFGPTYDHLSIVEACAPRGIHVMVEKPLATTYEHALRMQSLAQEHGIHLLTNYETSWYPTTEKAYQLVNDSSFVGEIKKVIFHTGHSGARNTESNKFFFRWLTHPVLNGGGALTDFGCYGANVMTYLMKGEEPLSVHAVTRQFKPEIYPDVDDEATIIVSYPAAQTIIQASWNWPFNRKDMTIYGFSGYIVAENDTIMRVRNRETPAEQLKKVTLSDTEVYDNPFSYFADVIRGRIEVPEFGLYSLENNVMVVRILDAARESAQTGNAIYFGK